MGAYLSSAPALGTDLNLEVLKERTFKPQPTSGSTESLWH